MHEQQTFSLFLFAWAGPTLTSLKAGCKIKVISRKFIATSQTIVFTQFVVLQHIQ